MAKPKVVREDAWEKDFRRRHTFEFRTKEAPEGFDELDLDKEVTLVIKGKVSGLEKRKNVDGLDMCMFTITMSSLAIQPKPKTRQIHEALSKERENRRI